MRALPGDRSIWDDLFPAALEPAAMEAPREGLPWDLPGVGIPRLRAVSTAGSILARPGRSFRRVAVDEGIGRSYRFALIWLLAAVWIPLLYQFQSRGIFFIGWVLIPGSLYLLAFALLIAILVAPFVFALATHVFLMFAAGLREHWERTFVVVAYSMGAAALVGGIPVAGPWLFVALWTVLATVGLAETQRVSLHRACLAASLAGLLELGTLALVGLLPGTGS